MDSSTVIYTKKRCFQVRDCEKIQDFDKNITEIDPAHNTLLKEKLFTSLKIAQLSLSQVPEFVPCQELKTVLDNTVASDFTIVCKDDEKIQVHSSIISSFWPFFNKMMSNDCKERTDRSLILDFEVDLVKLMISFIYKQHLSLTLVQAIALLQLSDMYLLPDMGTLASSTIREKIKTETNLEVFVDGWEICRETNNSELQQLFAKRIAHCKLRDNSEIFEGMDQEKLVELFFDAVQLTE